MNFRVYKNIEKPEFIWILDNENNLRIMENYDVIIRMKLIHTTQVTFDSFLELNYEIIND